MHRATDDGLRGSRERARRCAFALFALLLVAWPADAGAAPAAPTDDAPPAALLAVAGQIDGRPNVLAWHDGVLLAGLGRTLAAFDIDPDGRADRRIAPAATVGAGPASGRIDGLWLDGDRAYVRIDGGPIELRDVADAANPARLGTIEVRGAGDVLPLGDRLLLLDGGRVAAYDVRDPRAPARLGGLAAPYGFVRLGGRAGRVVATGYPERTGPFEPYAATPVLAVTLDAHDPAAMAARGQLAIGSSGYGYDTWTAGIAVTGDVATVFTGYRSGFGFSGIIVGYDSELGFRGIDVHDPSMPTAIAYPATSSAPLWADGAVAAGPAAAGGTESMYMAVHRTRASTNARPALVAVDLRTPLSPTIRLADLPATAIGLAASADRVAAVDVSGTLRTFDVRPGIAPMPRGADVLVNATDIAVADDVAVVAHHGRGLQRVDVADPVAPRVTGELRTPGGAEGANAAAFVAPGIVAVADGPAGLVVVVGLERAASGAPLVLARLGDTGDARALAVADDIVYLAGRDGLGIVDVTEPRAPRLLSRLPAIGASHAVAVAAATAFVATDAGAVVAVDVADAAAPRLLGPIADVPAAERLAADGGQVYAAAGEHGLVVIDAATRTVRAALATPDRLLAVDVADGIAYVAGLTGGLRLADVRDPSAPRWMAAVALPGVDGDLPDARPSAVAHAAGRVYVAARAAGVVVVTAAIGPAIRRAYLPVVMRGFRHTGAKDVPCGPAGEVIRQPAASPDGRWIVCTDGRSLYKAAPDGDPAAVIPFGPLAVVAVDTPVFDGGGRRIVFGCAVDGAGWDICDVGTEGGDAADLTHGVLPDDWAEGRPSLSPDGRYLAFDAADTVGDDPSRAPNAADIYVLDLRSRALRRVTDDPAVDRFPSFFPDGRTILFRSERDGNSELYAIGVDGAGLRRLTYDDAYDAYGTVSPDGRAIAFLSSRSGHDDVYVMPAAGGEAVAVTDGLRAYREPRFTADGRALVLRAYRLPEWEYDTVSNDPNAEHAIVRLPLPARWWSR